MFIYTFFSCKTPQNSDTPCVVTTVLQNIKNRDCMLPRTKPGLNVKVCSGTKQPQSDVSMCPSQTELSKRFRRGPEQLSRYRDSLRVGRSGDRIPVGLRVSAPVQTGPRAHPASYITGTGSFPGVKRPGRGADHLSHLKLRLKEEQSIYSTSGPSWPVLG